MRVPAGEVPVAPVDPDAAAPDESDAVAESPPDFELDESPFSVELELDPGTLAPPVEVPVSSAGTPEVDPPLEPDDDPLDDPLGSADGQPPEVPSDPPVGKVEPPLDPDEPPLEPEVPPPESPEPLEPEDPPPELPPPWDGDDCPPLVAQPATSIIASASVGILNLIADSSRLLRGGEIIAPQE